MGQWVGGASADGYLVTGYKAAMCPHAIGGIPKGASVQQWQLNQDNVVIKTFDADQKCPRDPFLIFLFLLNLDFYYLV